LTHYCDAQPQHQPQQQHQDQDQHAAID